MESEDRFCWSCGSGIYKNDRFCRKCGVDLREPRSIEQGHEAKPEASYTPDPTPEVVVKEVPAAPTSSPPTPTPSSTAAAPSPKPESAEAKPPLGSIATIALYVIGALGWGLGALAALGAVHALLSNLDGVWQGNYWGVMNVVGCLLIGGVGFMVAKRCRKALRRRRNLELKNIYKKYNIVIWITMFVILILALIIQLINLS